MRSASRCRVPIAGLALLVAALPLGACSGSSGGGGSSSSSSSSNPTRTLNAYVSADSNASGYGGTCTKQVQDTSSCQSARTALGLSGQWLKFSCNVALSLADGSQNSVSSYSSATYVVATFVDLPDYSSNYYETSGTYSFTANSYTVTGNYNDLHKTFSPTFPDPNNIAQQNVVMYIPVSPAHPGTDVAMPLGKVGVAVNGVAIYDNLASGTDNIFAEDGSFDECQGHASSGGTYHYHSEPYSISYNDGNLIGVMRDGYFIYGNDTDRTEPTSGTDLYKYGGEVALLPDNSATAFYYRPTNWPGCYDQNSSHVSYADDGNATCDSTAGPTGSGSGTPVNAYFLTGHGNGGVFDTVPTGSQVVGGQTMDNALAGVRYYYGTPATPCTNCN